MHDYEVKIKDATDTIKAYRCLSAHTLMAMIPPESWQPTLDGLSAVYPEDALKTNSPLAILVEPDRWHTSAIPLPGTQIPDLINAYYFGLLVRGVGHPITGMTLRIERGYVFEKKNWSTEMDVLRAIYDDVNRKRETYENRLN